MKWISINDKKPTEDGMYVYRRHEGSMSGWNEIHPVIGFVKDKKMIGTGAFDWIKVTHWFKLPPKSEPQKDTQTTEENLTISVVMPRKLTSENGAKDLLRGEFAEAFDPDNCGNPYVVPVSWDTIKRIYDKIVSHYGA